MSLKGILSHSHIIAIIVVFVLIIGQDLYIFSIVGPAIDLTKGPEGVKEAQIFGNLRNMVTTIITHGLLIGIVFILLTRQSMVVSSIWTADKDGKGDINIE